MIIWVMLLVFATGDGDYGERVVADFYLEEDCQNVARLVNTMLKEQSLECRKHTVT